MNKKIHNIATKVREQFEQKQVPRTVLVTLYHKYNPGIDSKTFVQKAEALFPALNCGLASVYLRYVVGVGEVVQGKYLDKNHTFLKVSKNQILDITSDQYGGPKIYYGELKHPWSLQQGR